MPYIVGFTPKRGKRRYVGLGGFTYTRVGAKNNPLPINSARRIARRVEKDKGNHNIQVIDINGWGRPAKKRRSR